MISVVKIIHYINQRQRTQYSVKLQQQYTVNKTNIKNLRILVESLVF